MKCSIYWLDIGQILSQYWQWSIHENLSYILEPSSNICERARGFFSLNGLECAPSPWISIERTIYYVLELIILFIYLMRPAQADVCRNLDLLAMSTMG